MLILSRAALIVTIALALTAARAIRAQESVDDRLKKLEEKVETLSKENTSLKATIVDLQKIANRDEPPTDEGAIAIKSQIEEMIGSGTYETKIGRERLLTRDGGFVDNIIIGGEWRTRVDYRDNTADLLDRLDDNGLRLDYRFNLGFGFKIHDESTDPEQIPVNVSTWFEIQTAGRGANNTAESIPPGIAGSGGIGDFATRDNELDVVRLYQAYVRLDNILNTEGLMLQVGRQEMTYGSGLIVGTNEFFTGTVHDAIRLGFEIEKIEGTFNIFYAKEAAADGQVPPGISTGGLLTGAFRSTGDEDELLGMHSEWGFLDPVKLDFYYVYFNARSAPGTIRPDNVTSPNDPGVDAFGLNTLEGQIHTIGTWLHSDKLIDDVYLGLELAYQFGQDESHNDLDAGLIEFTFEWKLPVDSYNPRIYGGFYFAEGRDSGVAAGFSPLFISRHNNDPVFDRQYGPYSRFGNVDMIPSQNVFVIQAGFKFDPWQDWTLGLTYLYAWAHHSKEALSLTQAGVLFIDDRAIGHEVDLYARYRVSSHTDLFLNLSVFAPVADFFVFDFASTTNVTVFREDSAVAVGIFAQIQVRF